MVNFWNKIPGYTLVQLGSGITVSSPEFELFESMCWCHDEAFRTKKELDEFKKKKDWSKDSISSYRQLLGLHAMHCRQTVINAFLLIESFVNGVVHVSLSLPNKTLTHEQRLYLTERVKDKIGVEKQKFVSIENKLHEWIKIISPNNSTFDKGSRVFQEFMKIKEYRDAIVHLSASKVSNFRTIDFNVASNSVRTVIEMIKRISEFIAADSHNVEYPFWLKSSDPDGMFRVTRTIRLDLKDAT